MIPAALMLSPRALLWTAAAAAVLAGGIYIKILRGDLHDAQAALGAANERALSAQIAYEDVSAANDDFARAAAAQAAAFSDIRREVRECEVRVSEIRAALSGWQKSAARARERADRAAAQAAENARSLRTAREKIANAPAPAADDDGAAVCERARLILIEGAKAK